MGFFVGFKKKQEESSITAGTIDVNVDATNERVW